MSNKVLIDREVVLGALAALEGFHEGGYIREVCAAHISTLRAALAQDALDRLAETNRALGLDYDDPATAPPAVMGRSPWEKSALAQEPVAWRDHVEQRIRTWRRRTMNRSGDCLAIDDFMSESDIDDLVDFVCDEWVEPAAKGA